MTGVPPDPEPAPAGGGESVPVSGRGGDGGSRGAERVCASGAEDPAAAGGGARPAGRSSAGGGEPAPASGRDAAAGRGARRWALGWAAAWDVARRAGREHAAAREVPLERALNGVLGEALDALTDLPAFDTSAMDGWAVAGPGPWEAVPGGVLAGHAGAAALRDGQAVPIATGARVPRGATAVLRGEYGTLHDGKLHPASADPASGADIRPRGQECRAGDRLLPAGAAVTPAVLGLAAAAGYDTLRVLPAPRVEVLVLGDELLYAGLPRDGRVRDALGPMTGPWLTALGAEVTAARRLPDDADALLDAVRGASADLVVTTGGTASGPADHVRPVLRRLGARLLVDGVGVRPGHPMLLAELPRAAHGPAHLVGLPGNPLAAASGLLTLAAPLLRARAGRAEPPLAEAPTAADVPGHPHDTRLVPVVRAAGADAVEPLRFSGPAMLRGVAAADALAVVPPGDGAPAGTPVRLLELPW